MYSDSTRRLHSRKSNGLYRHRLTLEGSQGAHVSIAGQNYLSFCSNDYLGLANHPELIEAVCEGAHQYGVGAGASHLIIGHHTSHHKLEEMLANFTGFPRASPAFTTLARAWRAIAPGSPARPWRTMM